MSTWRRDGAVALLLIVVSLVLAHFIALSRHPEDLDKGTLIGVLLAIVLVTVVLVIAVLLVVKWATRLDDERSRLDDLERRIKELEGQYRR